MKIEVRKQQQYQGHKGSIYTLEQAPEPGHFLSAGSEGIVAEWNKATGDARAVASATDAIFSMRMIPERDLLILGLQSGVLVFAAYSAGTILKTIQAHQKGIFDLQEFPGTAGILSSGQDGWIRRWNLDSFQLEQEKQISEKSIRTMLPTTDGNYLFVGDSANQILILDPTLETVRAWQAHKLSVFRLLFTKDKNLLLSVSRDAEIKAWDPADNFSLHTRIPAHNYAINDLIMHPDGHHFFTASMDKTIKIWRTEDLTLSKVILRPRNESHTNCINRLLWHEGQLLSAGDDRLVMGWDISV